MPAYGANQVRIIAGQYRGRFVSFPAEAEVRPTGDRIRETLFNWLRPWLPGARCLDLFAGSGALGIEAASRGAGEVVLVDNDVRVIDHLHSALRELECERVRVLAQDAQSYLATGDGQFDIVFIDPPFNMRDLDRVGELLVRGDWLVAGSHIYVETARQTTFHPPPTWQQRRTKSAGRVSYSLYEYV